MGADLELTAEDRAGLAGERGGAIRFALGIVERLARAMVAGRLRDITGAHIDGCLYHGRASLDFVERMVDLGGTVRVPTTLNVGSVDLVHPANYRGDPARGDAGRRLMEAYAALGCRQTFTCAPYQLPVRPGFGEHVAWGESNAIVFANSVLGARTNRYGDFVDLCAAVSGRVPDAGLHRDEARRGQVLFRLDGISDRLLHEHVFYHVLGHLVGLQAGQAIPVIDGLPPDTTEDQCKAIGAAAASSGAVAMFHAVGVTPEAPTRLAAFGGAAPRRTVRVTPETAARARDQLTLARGRRVVAVSVGTPHYSPAEFGRLVALLDGIRVHPEVDFCVSTGRWVLDEVRRRGWLPVLEQAGIRVVVDTCTYITPILRRTDGVVMTDSGKWAYYAPGNLGVEVAFGSLRECVESAKRGEVWRDAALWG